MPKKISLDEIMSKRQFSVKPTEKGDALMKIVKAPSSWDATNRSANFVMTTQQMDRYGDIVVTKGGDLSEFEKNPVVLWAHNSRGFPIGMWSDIKKIGGGRPRMEGRANLAPEETTDEADQAAKLVAANMLRACSIGFMPKEWSPIDPEHPWDGYQFDEWELLECSICSVPANPGALVKSAGGDEGIALQAIALVLDEWAKTPDGLIVPREQYERAYKTLRNKDVSVHEVRAVDEDDDVKIDVIEPDVEEIRRVAHEGAQKALAEYRSKSVTDRVVDKLKEMFDLTPKAAPEETEVEKPAIPSAEDVIREAEQADAKAAEKKAAEEEAAHREAEALASVDEEAELELRARAMALLGD